MTPETRKSIEVVLVEDNLAYLNELGILLKRSPDIKVVGQYTHGKEAVKGIKEKSPDVVLIDMELPDITGVEVIENLLSMSCPSEFLVLTVYDDDSHLFPALQAGAVGYIVKGETTLEEIESAIVNIVDGGAPMSPIIAKRVLETFRKPRPAENNNRMHSLTKRELQILELVAKGYSVRKVSDVLHISYETVRTHLKNIYQKLHVHTLVEAMLLYKKN